MRLADPTVHFSSLSISSFASGGASLSRSDSKGTGPSSVCQIGFSSHLSNEQNKHIYFSWIQKGFTVEPREMIQGHIFSEMIRIQTRQSELQAKIGVTDQKSGLQLGRPQNPNRIAQKGPQMELRRFRRKPPLKPS